MFSLINHSILPVYLFVIFRDENYCTALILAASKGHVKVIHHLIENMAEANVSDKLKVRHSIFGP